MNEKICTETFGYKNPSNIKTYIKLGNSLKDCTFDHKWIIL